MTQTPAAAEADVVVVGGGGAGLAAASEAARLGRSVILLEKNPELGGSTALSVGSISATCTPEQIRCGIKDSPQEHFEDLELLAGPLAPRDNRALRRLLTENTIDMMTWLKSTGLVFVGPMPEPPHRYPRMHNVLPNSKAFPYCLGRHCRRLGVNIRLNTAAVALIKEGGRIVGVAARTADGGTWTFAAHAGVVLAAGDYSASPGMKAELGSPQLATCEPVNPTATGEGFGLALEHGAVIVNGDIIRGPVMRFVPPRRRPLVQVLPPVPALARLMRWSFDHLPAWLLRPFVMSFLTTALGPSPELFRQGAVLINAAGERFADECDKPAHGVIGQPGGIAYIVFDRKVADRFGAWPYFISTAPGIAYAYLWDYRRTRRDIYHSASSLERLAERMGVPGAALSATIATHNSKGGAKDGADHPPRPPLDTPPYYALGPVKSYVVFTDGGLKVTERLEVVTEDGSVIPGLYAAGSTGQGGVLLEGHGHHLGWAFISGRIAGRNAAFESVRMDPGPAATAAGWRSVTAPSPPPARVDEDNAGPSTGDGAK